MATIAILSAVTLVAVGTSVSLYFNVGKANGNEISIQLYLRSDLPEVNKKVDQALNEFKEIILLKGSYDKNSSGQRVHDEDKKINVSKNWMTKVSQQL
ncbi:hypothetical protein P7H25_02315 [Paenibacillus larvae]|nr:hypothetical protein [Paenibacillus larvae]MDT2254714.1 hypothetical protein [Paenibacillus larvae]